MGARNPLQAQPFVSETSKGMKGRPPRRVPPTAYRVSFVPVRIVARCRMRETNGTNSPISLNHAIGHNQVDGTAA